MSKNTSIFRNTINFVRGNPESGLVYGTATVGELINKDTDGDGVLDWEEPLWGLDPTKKETTPGMPDSTVIAKLKAENGTSGYESAASAGNSQGAENLTETDKFSRELFSTVAALSQGGVVDQATINQIGDSLTNSVTNSPPRKIYTLSDIKIIKNDLYTTIKNYVDTLNNIFKNYQMNYTVIDVLQKFIVDENSVDTSVLVELDPIIQQMQSTVEEMTKMNVPESLASLHLDFLNGLERVVENLNDIRLYDSDAILSLSGISKYDQNTAVLQLAIKNLSNVISQKLSN